MIFRTIIFIILLVGVPSGVIIFTLWITRKSGRKKLGHWLSGIIVIGLLMVPASFFLEDLFFSKKEMKEMLEEHSLILQDDFKVSTKSISGIRDMMIDFNITISDSDRANLILEFQNSEFFLSEPSEGYYISDGKPRYSDLDTSFTATFENEWNYVYQCYKPNKQGYTPQLDIINIPKSTKTLRFQRIYD